MSGSRAESSHVPSRLVRATASKICYCRYAVKNKVQHASSSVEEGLDVTSVHAETLQRHRVSSTFGECRHCLRALRRQLAWIAHQDKRQPPESLIARLFFMVCCHGMLRDPVGERAPARTHHPSVVIVLATQQGDFASQSR